MNNITRLRIGASNDVRTAKAIAIDSAYGNLFYVPLDFELLESHMPFYQSALGDRLEYELTFSDYSRVILTASDSAAKYSIGGISLEFDVVTQPDLARMVRNQYTGRVAILYDRVLRHRKINKDKSDTLWNMNLNVPARSMKGILMLFEDPLGDIARDTEAFYNPKITKVEVTIEGIPNQLYSQGMRAYQQWDEASKALTKKRDMLSELAFSGRHAGQSVWVLTQKYNSVLKDLREQTKWIAVFHCKDRDSF